MEDYVHGLQSTNSTRTIKSLSGILSASIFLSALQLGHKDKESKDLENTQYNKHNNYKHLHAHSTLFKGGALIIICISILLRFKAQKKLLDDVTGPEANGEY